MDAYTMRKIAPRILVGVIAINLSIYLTIAVADVFQVIGAGLGNLLTAPFETTGTFDFGVEGNVANSAALLGGVGVFVGSGAAGMAVGGIIALATAPLATIGNLFIVILPIIFLALAVVATIVLRDALLMFLIVTSPIACALYILPGTERFARMWWDWYWRTLMVYPIIAAIFALSDIFGSIMFTQAAEDGDLAGVARILVGVLVLFAPLVLIPFSFQLAGGAMAQIGNLTARGARQLADAGFVKGRREIAARDLTNQNVQARSRVADRLKSLGSENESHGRFRRHVGNRAFRAASGWVGGHNIEARASQLRAEQAKIVNDQIATGRDEEVRGLTVDLQSAERQRQQGIGEGQTWRHDENGTLQYRSLGGAWVNESDVRAGYDRWGHDEYAKQAALSYEMRKANTTEEADMIRTGYESLATGSWGLDRGSATGVLKGAGFENQGKHLQFKYMGLNGTVDHAGMVREIYESKGSYSLAQMSAGTMEELVKASEDTSLSAETRSQLGGISETFMHDMASGRGQVGEQDGEPIGAGVLGPDGQPISPAEAAAQGGTRMFSSPGASSINEKARQLAINTGRYANPPDQDRHHQRPDAPQK